MRYAGDIYRPPGEWRSYLLQVTIGCSHNACTFCRMYKDKRYRVRPLDEIFEDIQMAKRYYGDLDRVFLCDGDAVAMDTDDLLKILNRLYETFPSLTKVTSYAGPVSTLRKTPEELRALREAGLKRVYLGVETGWDDLLKAVNKGATAQEMLEAGIRLREAGMDLWVMIILGLAGPGEPSRRHILETAAMINRMKPRHLSALTLTVDPGTRLYRDWKEGKFSKISPAESLQEVKLLLEHLDVDPMHFTCDHASNYLPLKGTFPAEKERFIALIESALDGEIPLRKEYGRGL